MKVQHANSIENNFLSEESSLTLWTASRRLLFIRWVDLRMFSDFVASGLDNLSFCWNTLKYASKVSAFFARGRSVEVAKFLLDQGASLSARFSKSEYLYFYILESSRFTSLSVYCPAFEIFWLDWTEHLVRKIKMLIETNRQTSQDWVGRHGSALRCQARSSLHAQVRQSPFAVYSPIQLISHAQVRWNYHSVYITCSISQMEDYLGHISEGKKFWQLSICV